MTTWLSRIDLIFSKTIGSSLRDNLDIFGLDRCEDLISLMEACSGVAVIGKDRTELEISLNAEGNFIYGAFENFHRDVAGKGIDASGIDAVEADFFWS
jgi:hypothetical protein